MCRWLLLLLCVSCAARGLEPVSAPLGTPQSSEAARPAWVIDDAYAPQYKWKIKGSSPQADVEGVLLRCTAERQRLPSGELFGGLNELYLTLQVNEQAVAGKIWTRAVSAPLVTLHPGDSLTLRAYDYDVFSKDELIDVAEVRYEGGRPLVANGYKASFECKIALREEIEEHFQQRLREFQRALTSLKRAPLPTVTKRELPRREYFGAGAKDKVEPLAALVGWDDPRVMSAVGSINELQRRYDIALQASIRRALKDASPAGETLQRGALFVTPSWSCSPRECAITLRTENTGALPMKIHYLGSVLDEVTLLNEAGDELELSSPRLQNKEGLAVTQPEGLKGGQSLDFIYDGVSPDGVLLRLAPRGALAPVWLVKR